MIVLASLKGIVASSGIAFGKAYKLAIPDLSYDTYAITSVDKEMNRLYDAVQKSREEIKSIRTQIAQHQGEENAAIFDSHLLMLDDPYYMGAIEQIVQDEKINVECALAKVTELLISTFKQLNNLYIRERINDIQDVVDRVLANLLGKSLPNISLIKERSIIVATDLKPSETVQIDQRFVQGFVTDYGGKTTHSAIIAKSLNLSAVVGTGDATTLINNGDELIVDAINGLVFINPSDHILSTYKNRQQHLNDVNNQLATYKNRQTETSDHYPLEIHANINSIKSLEQAKQKGIDGIGLFRTEFLFMESTNLPTELKQFNIYKSVLKKMKSKPVVIRTLDIGGDKQLPYYSLPEENNPFLGLRSIRFTLKEKTIFETQLRALLRASPYGNLKIMFPMITTIEELRAAKQLFYQAKIQLERENIPVSNDIEIGMMIETPAAAMLADIFIHEVDFFSIGTNDLIQYTFAIDRMNENVSHLYEPLHPAILRQINTIIDVAKQYGKWVKICGEMANDERAIPLLIGLGLTSFSMDSSAILRARKQIYSLSKKKMQHIAEKSLRAKGAQEVIQLLIENQILEQDKTAKQM